MGLSIAGDPRGTINCQLFVGVFMLEIPKGAVDRLTPPEGLSIFDPFGSFHVEDLRRGSQLSEMPRGAINRQRPFEGLLIGDSLWDISGRRT